MAIRKNVAIIGKAPSSRELAPYGDDSWEIWSLSDNYNVLPRWDRWFELHDDLRYKRSYPEYYDWMSAQPGPEEEGYRPIYMWPTTTDIPAGVLFDHQQLTSKYGFYFNNSISWMMAWAYEELLREHVPTECKVGVWGVDMATDSEYSTQKPSCEYIIGWGMGMGFDVVVPPECDLLKCGRLYAIEANRGTLDHKLRARHLELTKRRQKHTHELEQARQAKFAAAGAFQELQDIASALNGQSTPEMERMLDARMKHVREQMDSAAIADKELDITINRLAGAIENCSWGLGIA